MNKDQREVQMQAILSQSKSARSEFWRSLDFHEPSKGSLRTDTKKGEFLLSPDSSLNNGSPPVICEIDSIQKLKKLTGCDDSLFDLGVFSSEELEFPVWDSTYDHTVWKDLPARWKAILCRACQAYIYGDSRKVAAYEDVLNRKYFPMKIACFTGESIVVTKDHPLIIDPGSSPHPVVLHYDSITLEEGAKIISKKGALVHLESDYLRQEGRPDMKGSFVLQERVAETEEMAETGETVPRGQKELMEEVSRQGKKEVTVRQDMMEEMAGTALPVLIRLLFPCRWQPSKGMSW